MKRSVVLCCVMFIATLGWAATESYPSDLLKDRKFKESYYGMLGGKKAEKWLTTLSGPAEPATVVKVAGAEYLFFHCCKPHECNVHNIVVLYSPKTSRCYGKLRQDRATSTLGSPSAEISAALDKFYDEQFGENN